MDQDEFTNILQDILSKSHSGSIESLITKLNQVKKLCLNGEIRDFDWVITPAVNLYNALFFSLEEAWKAKDASLQVQLESIALEIYGRILITAEFDRVKAYDSTHINPWFSTQIIKRISSLAILLNGKSPSKELVISCECNIRGLQILFLEIYNHVSELRGLLRISLCNDLVQSATSHVVMRLDTEDTRLNVKYLLQILHVIINGLHRLESLHSDTFKIRKELLLDILLPLHAPNDMILWRDQIPIIQTYHEELVRCIATLIDNSSLSSDNFLIHTINYILSNWPDSFNSNTPKQVLLLHELEIFVERCSIDEFKIIQGSFLKRISKCIGTNADNIRPAQRALQMFKNKKLLNVLLMKSDGFEGLSIAEYSMNEIILALFRNGQVSWNPTVNKMTALALKSLKETDLELFRKSCYLLQGSNASAPVDSFPFEADKKINPLSNIPRSSKSTLSEHDTKHTFAVPPKPTVINSNPTPVDNKKVYAMDPPFSRPKMPKLDAKGQPPVTITGVAPWAMAPIEKGSQPPVTITGVAPWAMTSAVPSRTIPSISESKALLNASRSRESSQIASDGYQMVLQYMTRCYDQVFNENPVQQEQKEWYLEQAAIEPSLLPELKFHDLVFGNILGEGAFSVVKYARQIIRGKSQSQWPEYAVKVIDAKKVLEFDYAVSVVREISVLLTLQHPGIARMVSAFKYNQSAYLVLEYAGKGDLHSFLLKSGKLSHSLLRFVLGEITSTLWAIHQEGFCFNDLKPENILITELGHVKITDFGACRPYTPPASKLLTDHCMQLTKMRDGNWKDSEENENDKIKQLFDTDTILERLEKGDERCEGTVGYMPPEALSRQGLLGLGNDILADSWALGCVAFFGFHGKPRFYGEIDQVMDEMRDWFEEIENSSVHSSHKGVHFNEYASSTDEGDDLTMKAQDQCCEDFIKKLLQRNRSSRSTIETAIEHPYLIYGYPKHVTDTQRELLKEACPVYNPRSLHLRSPPEWPDISKDRNAGDERWARRQFSTLWAPMPHAYQLDDSNSAYVKPMKLGNKDDAQFILRMNYPAVLETESDEHLPFYERNKHISPSLASVHEK